MLKVANPVLAQQCFVNEYVKHLFQKKKEKKSIILSTEVFIVLFTVFFYYSNILSLVVLKLCLTLNKNQIFSWCWIRAQKTYHTRAVNGILLFKKPWVMGLHSFQIIFLRLEMLIDYITSLLLSPLLTVLIKGKVCIGVLVPKQLWWEVTRSGRSADFAKSANGKEILTEIPTAVWKRGHKAPVLWSYTKWGSNRQLLPSLKWRLSQWNQCTP